MLGFRAFLQVGAARGACDLSEGDMEGVSHGAFQNPDGGRIAVLANTGHKQNVPLRFGNQATK